MRPLLFPVNLWSDESVLGSYQLRLRRQNSVGSLRMLEQVYELPRGSLSPEALLLNPDAIRTLAQIGSLDPSSLAGLPVPLESASGHVLRWHAGELSAQYWTQGAAQVCPSCLADHGYLDERVGFWHLPVCIEHGQLLVDRCSSCNQRLGVDRPSLCHCGQCGASLLACPTTQVSEATRQLVKSLATLCPTSLQASDGRVELDASRTASLLCLLAGAGFTPAFAPKLSAVASRLSVVARVGALDLMAACMGRECLAAGRLLDALLDANRHVISFRDTPVFRWWLSTGLRELGLGIRAMNALIFDTVSDVGHYAVHRERAAMLTASTQEELLSGLGLSLYELEELSLHVPLSKSSDDVGYDADDIAQARNFVQACLTEAELDDRLGAPGMAGVMASHGLLREFAPRATPHRRFTPDSVLALLGRIADKFVDGSSLASVPLLHGQDAFYERGAVNPESLLRLLMGRALPVAWPAPFRLADVVVTGNSAVKSSSAMTTPKKVVG